MMRRARSDEAGVLRRLADFRHYVIGDTFSAANEGLKGRVVGELAEERGQDPFDTLVEIVSNDELRTVLWPMPPDNDPDTWALRTQVWGDDRAMLGGSDAGAHLDRMCGAPYTTRFVGDMIRGRQLVPLEEAVRLITDAPAQLFGLKERGRIEVGWHADLVVFDPATIDSEPATPGGRPARRRGPADGRLDRCGQGAGQRTRDGCRRPGHRRHPGDPAPLGTRHPHGGHVLAGEWRPPRPSGSRPCRWVSERRARPSPPPWAPCSRPAPPGSATAVGRPKAARPAAG